MRQQECKIERVRDVVSASSFVHGVTAAGVLVATRQLMHAWKYVGIGHCMTLACDDKLCVL